MQIYTSTETARLLGIPFYRLYYLELTNRITPARRTATGRRYYTTGDVEVLKEEVNETKKRKRKREQE